MQVVKSFEGLYYIGHFPFKSEHWANHLMKKHAIEIGAATILHSGFLFVSLVGDIWSGPELLPTAGSFRAAEYCLPCFVQKLFYSREDWQQIDFRLNNK